MGFWELELLQKHEYLSIALILVTDFIFPASLALGLFESGFKGV
ncbi:hypothetical protein DET49_10730 [Salegentibacter sp. 24]|nr:hypothetical protein DET49_10730 [Salegentibacter sp. 24]